MQRDGTGLWDASRGWGSGHTDKHSWVGYVNTSLWRVDREGMAAAHTHIVSAVARGHIGIAEAVLFTKDSYFYKRRIR